MGKISPRMHTLSVFGCTGAGGLIELPSSPIAPLVPSKPLATKFVWQGMPSKVKACTSLVCEPRSKCPSCNQVLNNLVVKQVPQHGPLGRRSNLALFCGRDCWRKGLAAAILGKVPISVHLVAPAGRMFIDRWGAS
jgi:hypothetical protein